jgi:hypothetical protein
MARDHAPCGRWACDSSRVDTTRPPFAVLFEKKWQAGPEAQPLRRLIVTRNDALGTRLLASGGYRRAYRRGAHPCSISGVAERVCKEPGRVLCLNVSPCIGVIGMASPMLQEIFAGDLGQAGVKFNALTPDQRAIAAIAAGFTGLLSQFNILLVVSVGRRFPTPSAARIPTTFLLLGIVLYALAPIAACITCRCTAVASRRYPHIWPICSARSFAGAIHRRLLTAWSTAGIIGPVVSTNCVSFNSQPVCLATSFTIPPCRCCVPCWSSA